MAEAHPSHVENQRQNHPREGDAIKVEPIRRLEDIRRIRDEVLADCPRNRAIFIVGINTNLRASDILKLKVGQVRGAQVGDDIMLKEKKTRKNRAITINRKVHEAVADLLETMPNAKDSDPLFQSRKSGKPLTVPYLNNMVKRWAGAIGLRGNFGSHTLRKTFGYVHRTVHNTPIPILMVMFNHASQQETLNYLCIQSAEVRDAYLQEVQWVPGGKGGQTEDRVSSEFAEVFMRQV